MECTAASRGIVPSWMTNTTVDPPVLVEDVDKDDEAVFCWIGAVAMRVACKVVGATALLVLVVVHELHHKAT